MAETVYLPTGETEVILIDKGTFLERLIRDRLGDDVARLYAEIREEQKASLWRFEHSADESERAADGYLSLCNDAMSQFEYILTLLDAPVWNKKDIKKAVKNGYDNLYNNL